MGSFFKQIIIMIRKLLTYFTFPIIFVWLLVVSYNSSKRKPDSVMELLTDPSWLYDWPKWLDIPLMKWINDGFKVFNEKYGIYFEVINDFLLGAISITQKILNCFAMASGHRTCCCNCFLLKWKKAWNNQFL